MNKCSSFLLLIIFISFSPLYSNTLVVTSPSDSGPGSLREAVESSAKGDTIMLMVSDTIKLEKQIVIFRDVYIRGRGVTTSILDGQQQTRHFYITDSAGLEISDLSLVNGDFSSVKFGTPDPGGSNPDGGSMKVQGQLNIRNILFSHNRATFGGALSLINVSPGRITIEIENAAFINNIAESSDGNPLNFRESGAAIYQDGRSGDGITLRVQNSTFSNNRAIFAGGGFNTEGDITGGTDAFFTHCTFAENSADRGAGVQNIKFSAAIFDRCIFANNQANSNPDVNGALISRGYNLIQTLSLNNEWVADSTDILNVDAQLSGLTYFGDLPTHGLGCLSPAIDAIDVPKNIPEDQRGQIRIGAPDIGAHEKNSQVDNLIFNLNDSGVGTVRLGVELSCPGDTISLDPLEGTIRLSRPIFLRQDISILGSAEHRINLDGSNQSRIIEVDTSVRVLIRNLNFQHGNPDRFGGGAIYNNGEVELHSCTFWENKAVSGGAVANYGYNGPAKARFVNCTFSGNRTEVLDGGAVDNLTLLDTAVSEFINCTFAENFAENRGGAISNVGGKVFLRNTLMGRNTALESSPNLYGGGISLGNNLVEDTTGSGYLFLSTDILNQAPEIDPLGNYEGPTLTHRLKVGSPAIDQGSNEDIPLNDQRGFPRIFNSVCDIGAYEYNPVTSSMPLYGNERLTVYPNPVNNLCRLRFDRDKMGSRVCLIINVEGKVMAEFTLEDGSNTLDLSSLLPGIYILKLDNKAKKIVKL